VIADLDLVIEGLEVGASFADAEEGEGVSGEVPEVVG